MEGYAIAIQNGFMSPNDVRSLENLNPIPAELGAHKVATMIKVSDELLNDPEFEIATGGRLSLCICDTDRGACWFQASIDYDGTRM
jgi:hypothetical protein